jgi:hypothetical protein
MSNFSTVWKDVLDLARDGQNLMVYESMFRYTDALENLH